MAPVIFWIYISVSLLVLSNIILLFYYRERDNRNETNPLPTYRASLPEINREFSRARRSNRPLSIIVIRLCNAFQMEKYGASRDLLSQLNQVDFFYCGQAINHSLREIDLVTYDRANKQYLIFLPETTKEQAAQLADRFKEIFGERVHKRLNFGIAEFPKDGLFAENLIEHAMSSIKLTEYKPIGIVSTNRMR